MIHRMSTLVTSYQVEQADFDLVEFEKQAVYDTLMGRAVRLGFNIDGIEPVVTVTTEEIPIEGNPEQTYTVHRIDGEFVTKDRNPEHQVVGPFIPSPTQWAAPK